MNVIDIRISFITSVTIEKTQINYSESLDKKGNFLSNLQFAYMFK